MSGHSKWSTIKRQKGAADAKRGQVFTKMGNAITIAVREGGGGDPAANFKLRLAIEQARGVNMPKENIQRAIDRGLGKGGEGGQLESATYEGYGPGKVALIVEATTDNKNRTTAEVKNVIERSGGSFVSPGTVSWMFSDEGMIVVVKNGKSFEEIFDVAAESGAQDVVDAGDLVEVYTKPADLESVKKNLINRGLTPTNAEISKKPATIVGITNSDTAKKIMDLMERLEDLDDVQKVWSNFDIPDSILSQTKI
ncbi:YebC/PmpR family DNA-binding transcriptional regulator [Candidatus Curtissbacteria bacterium]|nr:YebC/PmpR family DNA-binding transcriptional regulator [Candidatus Curtissbacteria bacterium]